MLLLVALAAPAVNAQWVQQASGTTSTLSDVAMLDARTAIAVGRSREILRTSDAGATWSDVTAVFSSTYPWSAVSFCDSLHGTVVGDNGSVRTTSDGGKTWPAHWIAGGRNCLSVLQTGPNSIYVGTDSGWVFFSSDTGRTWTGEKISNGTIRSLFMYRGPTVEHVLLYALTPYSICRRTSFPVAAWSESVLSGFLGLGSEAYDAEFCNGGGAGFIVGVQGDLRAAPAILRRTPSDTVWRFAATGIRRDGTFLGVSAPSASVIYVCGSEGMIFRSTDGGDSWTDQSVKTLRALHAISFCDETHGVAVGDSGRIYFTSNGGLTAAGEPGTRLPKHFMLEQNFPNPFNPATMIRYSIPDDGSVRVSLRVYDLLGCEIETLVNEVKAPGSHDVVWNAGGRPSGVYCCVLRAGNHMLSKKLMLLR